MRDINSIFIVDDDPITVFGIRKMLSDVASNGTITTYANGKLALETIIGLLGQGERLPEVIFLDINMPVMDGWQFLEEFLDLPIQEKIRINIITSSIDSRDLDLWHRLKDRSQHLITYNHKPIRRPQILEITKVA